MPFGDCHPNNRRHSMHSLKTREPIVQRFAICDFNRQLKIGNRKLVGSRSLARILRSCFAFRFPPSAFRFPFSVLRCLHCAVEAIVITNGAWIGEFLNVEQGSRADD